MCVYYTNKLQYLRFIRWDNHHLFSLLYPTANICFSLAVPSTSLLRLSSPGSLTISSTYLALGWLMPRFPCFRMIMMIFIFLDWDLVKWWHIYNPTFTISHLGNVEGEMVTYGRDKNVLLVTIYTYFKNWAIITRRRLEAQFFTE